MLGLFIQLEKPRGTSQCDAVLAWGREMLSAAPLSLQVRSFLGFVVHSLLQCHPSFWDFHNGVLSINSYQLLL